MGDHVQFAQYTDGLTCVASTLPLSHIPKHPSSLADQASSPCFHGTTEPQNPEGGETGAWRACREEIWSTSLATKSSHSPHLVSCPLSFRSRGTVGRGMRVRHRLWETPSDPFQHISPPSVPYTECLLGHSLSLNPHLSEPSAPTRLYSPTAPG